MGKKLKDIEGLLPSKRKDLPLSQADIGFNNVLSRIGDKELEIDVERVKEILKRWNITDELGFRYKLAQVITKEFPVKVING